ncbi:RNA recognition motif family protein [Leishmania donovani]|uniref:RNA recognition motif family protein n=1 Tax=Leishmania donovani TaxID=5661 RepID=A0A504XPQ6_LEIDO|nr:RNA recognition motif family protein [Leishmania donovani]
MPNTCSKGQLLDVSCAMRATDDSDMAAPGDGADGADRHALGSPGDGVGGAGPQPHPLRRQLGLEGCTDAFSSDEGDASATPEAAGGAPLSGEVDVCSSSLSATARHQNLLNHVLLGGDSEFTLTGGPTIHSAPLPAQELMASGPAVAATATHLPVSSAPSRSFSSQGKPLSAILVPASRSDDSAAAARCYIDPFAAAVVGSGSTSRSSSVGIGRPCTSTGMEGLYGDHYVHPLLRSRSGRSGGSSGFFGGADDVEDDEDGSAALQAAVDAAVRFDDLASEDDTVSGGGERRRLLRAGPTALSHLLAVASDPEDGAFTCAHRTKADFSSPFGTPGGLGDGESERHQPHSPQTPGMQQCGRLGDRRTDGRPQMPNRAAIGATATPSSAPYFAASGSAIVSPLQSMQPLASPAAAAPNPATTIVTAGTVAKPSAPACSLTSPQQSSIPVPPSRNGARQLQLQQQQLRDHHHQCSSSLHPSPHGRKASPVAVPHTFPAGTAAMPKLDDVDSFRYVSPPQASIAATHHHSVSGASIGGSTAAQNSTDISFAVQLGTAGSGTGTGIGGQTPSNSLLSSPSVQPFYLYQVPQATAYVGSGQVVAAHLHPAPPTTAAATAVLGDSSRARSTSTPSGSYQRPAVTQQQQPQLCSRYGAVLSAKVAHHSTTNESLGYGFVLFEHKQSAVTCMAMLNQAHVHAEGEESRTLLVRMAHATAAPGFQEEGASDSTASSLRQPTELTPPSGSVSRAGAAGGRLPHRELSGASVADAHRGQAPPHSIGDSIRTNANASSNTSCAGGDSLRCTSPVGGAGNNSCVAVSRTSMPPSFSETFNFMSPKGAAKALAPPLRGLYRVPSTNTTSSLFRSATAGATATATAMAAAATQRAGCNFCSPLSLSPNDTASLLLLSPSAPHPTVQLPQSLHAPCASVSGKASSAKPASATTSTRNVYITNLPLTWNTTKLRELCGRYGEIVSASVAHHPETNGSRGYGFVLFAEERDAAACVMALHHCRVPASPHVLRCRFAKDKATPPIAYALLSPSQQPGRDSVGSGSGSPLPTATVGGSPTAATSKTMVPMIAMGGDADVFESSLASNGTGNSTRVSTKGAVQDAVCMPIDVFCTLQQRVHAQCVQYLTQKHQLQRKGTEDNSEPTSAVVTAEVQSEELENMMRSCVVYGAHVPTQGYGCVRPMDCRKASFRRAVARSPTAAVVEDAEQLLSGPPAEPSTPASSGLRSVGSALSTERGDPSGEVLEAADTAAPVTLPGTAVCTHAIAVGCAQPASPTLAGTTTMPAAPSTRRSMSDEPSCAPPRGVGMPDAESASRVATPEAMASPAAPLELWYTCTLFTTQLAAEAFVRAAAEASLGSGATINAGRGDFGTSSGIVVDASTVQLSSNGKGSLADTTLPSPSPSFDKTAKIQQTRFGLRDQVMVLSSAPLTVPAAPLSTSSANDMAANSTRLHPTEEPNSQHRPTATPPQQQYQWHHLRPSHQLPPPTPLHAQTRDGSAAASATQPRGSSLCSATGIAAAAAHPSASTAEPAPELSQPPHLQQQRLLCFPSSAETFLCSLPSHAAHYTYPRVALTSPADDLVTSASAGAAGRYPSATVAECAYLLGSPASTSSVSLSTGTHILSGSTPPPLGVALNFPSASSTHSALFSAAGAGSPSGHPAPAVHAAPAAFAAAPSHMAATRAWSVATSGAAAAMSNVLSAPPPVSSGPSSSLSTEQAPPPPPHISYPLGSTIYAVPEAAALTAPATGGPPVFSAAPISDAASPATPASSAQVSCTTPNATSQRSAQPLHP